MREKMDLDLENLWKEFELLEQPATEKQKAILSAAEELFSERGFDASPTAEIARRAKVTERTLFKYFPSKAGLLRRLVFGAIVKTLLPTQLKKVRAIAKTPFSSAREFVLTLGRDRVENVKQHAPRLRILLGELIQNAPFRQQFAALVKKHVWADLVRTVEDFQKKGQLRSDLPATVIVQTVLFTVMGFAISRYVFPVVKTSKPEQDLEVLLGAILGGIDERKSPID